jgi:hypothetical protein
MSILLALILFVLILIFFKGFFKWLWSIFCLFLGVGMIYAWVTGGYSDNHTPFGISLHQNEEAHEAAKTPEQCA